MTLYKIEFSVQAKKDYKVLCKSSFKDKADYILECLAKDPYVPPGKELKGNLKGKWTARINQQHRVAYTIDESTKSVLLIQMWEHYP